MRLTNRLALAALFLLTASAVFVLYQMATTESDATKIGNIVERSIEAHGSVESSCRIISVHSGGDPRRAVPLEDMVMLVAQAGADQTAENRNNGYLAVERWFDANCGG